MRKLVFLAALLCCSTQAMAADPCASLQGKSLSINGNGFKGVIGPNGINLVNQNNTFTFQTTANFLNEPADPVTGECKDWHMQFTRTRQGVWTQTYDGFIFAKEPSKAAGTFSHKDSNGSVSKAGWYVTIVPVSPPPPPPLPDCDAVAGEPCSGWQMKCQRTDANGNVKTVTCACGGKPKAWACP